MRSSFGKWPCYHSSPVELLRPDLKSPGKSTRAALAHTGIDECRVCLHSRDLTNSLHMSQDTLSSSQVLGGGTSIHEGGVGPWRQIQAPGAHFIVQRKNVLQMSGLQFHIPFVNLSVHMSGHCRTCASLPRILH